jgi:hypothetical protein
MKKINKGSNYIISVLVIVITLLLLVSNGLNKKNINLISTINDKEEAIGNLTYRIKKDSIELNAIINTINCKVEDVNIVSSNDYNTNLLQLTKESPKLFFRINYSDCMECVEEIISLLENMADSIGVENIIILTRFKKLTI